MPAHPLSAAAPPRVRPDDHSSFHVPVRAPGAGGGDGQRPGALPVQPLSALGDSSAAAPAAQPAPVAPAAATDRTTSHPHLSVAAAAFVCLALVALAASPLLTFRRLDALQSESAATTVAAASDLAELRLLFSEEALMHQALRTAADATPARRYGVLRAREDVLLTDLARVAPRVGPGVARHVALLRERAGRWHALTDARAAGAMHDTTFGRRLPEVRALREATLAEHAQLAADVQQVDAAHHGIGAHVVADQRRLSAALGGLALLAAGVVGGFARRERRLTQALARAVDEEHRLRAEAERQREEAERQREAAERQREAVLRVGESKARLVRGFTHDVKNPIGAADGYLALLEDGIPDPATPGQRGYLERSRRSLRAALHLIGDLLDVARAESGAIEVRLVPTDLAAVARDAAEEYRAEAERKGLRLDVVCDDDPAAVTTDAVRVRQVLGNLISNAVKYTERGRVVVRLLGARAEAGADATGGPADRPTARVVGRYAVEVSDTGAGIAPEHQARLFEEFVRLAPDAAPGVGLGLAISRRIARALDGDLAVRSTPGHGSTFVLWLPASADTRVPG
ncbi:hypothetical protein tb265_41160 [Gemmatimonadetes bacterium T265]|nr:hypothetical protein tb265_41160 [Gemmatimonadetes bacterium T265]